MSRVKPVKRAGILGSGFSAGFHMKALRRIYGVDVEVSGVYSQTRDRREQFGYTWDIPVVASRDELFERSDVIHVCTPAYDHEPATVAALESGCDVVLEKPYTGYFPSDESGDRFSRSDGLHAVVSSVQRLRKAEARSKGRIFYAENWVYAPAIQKEREIIEKTRSQLLWMHGEESHSGSHAAYYGTWKLSGGGSLMGKGVHPLTAALYLKRIEGIAWNGTPIRPATVSGRVHAITRRDEYRDEGRIRCDYTDVEDYGTMHVEFEDGTVADIFSTELVQGGVHNWLEVNAGNHRSICRINPTDALQTFNPQNEQLEDVYVVEKTSTKEGWSFPSPDEDWFAGYSHEMQDFYESSVTGVKPQSDSELAADTVLVVYSAYVSAEKGGVVVDVPRTHD